jgi:Leucine-rich repeat (LRR) protein
MFITRFCCKAELQCRIRRTTLSLFNALEQLIRAQLIIVSIALSFALTVDYFLAVQIPRTMKTGSSVAAAADDYIENDAVPIGFASEETAGAMLVDPSNSSSDESLLLCADEDMHSTMEKEREREQQASSATLSASAEPAVDRTDPNRRSESTTTPGATAALYKPLCTKEGSSSVSFGDGRRFNSAGVKRPLIQAAFTNRFTTCFATAVGSNVAALHGGEMECYIETEQLSAVEDVGAEDGTLSSEPRQHQRQQNQEHQNSAEDAPGGNRGEEGREPLCPPADNTEDSSSEPPAPQGNEGNVQQSEPADNDPEPPEDDADDETRGQAPHQELLEHSQNSLLRASANSSYPPQERQDLPLAVPVLEHFTAIGAGTSPVFMSSAVVQAQPLEDWTQERENKKCCSKENGAWWLTPTQWAIGALLLVVLIVVGAVIGVTQTNDGNSSGGISDGIAASTDAPISDEATSVPTTAVDNTDVVSLPTFPPFSSKLNFLTIQAVADPTSAHSKANSWMMQDPNRDGYDEPRQMQRFALATLYYSTRGNRWRRNDLWLDYEHDECQWYNQVNQETEGAICDDNSNIIRLKLSDNGLDGVLPLELFFFPALASLDLSQNGLYGTTPTMFQGAGNLKRLIISSNQLTGQFTAELGFVASQLAVLHTDDNLFTGAVPGLLRLLPKLYDLNITGNQYTGALPSSLIQLSNTLAFMEVAQNSITGEIPSELGMTTHLQRLDVGRNANLQGTIPSQLSALVNLTFLNVDDTRVSGSLPHVLCELRREGQLQVEADCAGLFQCCSK